MQTPTEHILNLFQKYGKEEYGERCTVSSHSVQAGLIAQEQGLDDELILSAFLHDIGHLYPLELSDSQHAKMGTYGIEAHDKWGEDFLRSWGFPDRLIAPVRNHVAAKRYLCFRDATYYDELSMASKMTLKYQGGPMSEEEVRHFESLPYFEESVIIRKIDDEAKILDFDIQANHWDFFRQLLDKALNKVR